MEPQPSFRLQYMQHCGLRRCGECSVTTRSKLRAQGGVWRAETGARRTVRTKGRILNIPRYWLAGKWATVQLLRKGAWPVADVAQLLRVGKFQAAECLAFQSTPAQHTNEYSVV